MNHCGLSNKAIMYLARGLKHNQTLKHLSIGQNNFMDAQCIKYLTDALKSHKGTITELELHKCGLTTQSLILLSKLIASQYKLKSLNLKSNGIGDEAA